MESKNRLQELERLMCRIYEDMILEKYQVIDMRYLTVNMKQSK